VIQTNLPLNIQPQSKAVNLVFARHETFHPRFGWLKKGFDAASKDSLIFTAEDAAVRLGVGKNMVRSIRYWCNAFKVLENDRPSKFGDQLFGEVGWDTFCEDPASLWLLHWNLLKQPCNATAWYFAFYRFLQADFLQNDLFMALCQYRDSFGVSIAESSIHKDISCILRMYVEVGSKTGPSEDSLDCPFTELGIIHATGESKHFTFRFGQKSNLPPAIIVATCLEFANSVGYGQQTIAISRLLYDVGSPGMAFKLNESAICDAIEKIARQTSVVALSDSAGLIQFSFYEDPLALAAKLLDNYYSTKEE